jgi:hypothetical protein
MAERAAEQLVHRRSQSLAANIPQSLIDAQLHEYERTNNGCPNPVPAKKKGESP